mmetsp:Transcript_1726/g.5410  ORF Transcript_1726/g.5410 Transcript_1726/m.5410 type:complete len:501 (+) Transcript_1726:56-1558(+)
MPGTRALPLPLHRGSRPRSRRAARAARTLVRAAAALCCGAALAWPAASWLRAHGEAGPAAATPAAGPTALLHAVHPLAAAAIAAWWTCVVLAALLAWGLHADVPAEEAFRRHCLPGSQRWLTSGGEVHVLRWVAGATDAGHAPDVTVVCLHGTFDSGHAFAAWAEALAAAAGPWRSLEVLAPDLPGHGLTGPWAAPAAEGGEGRAADVAFLREVLTSPGPLTSPGSPRTRRRVVLVGHSLGAAVATAYASQYPDDVLGLVLLAPWGLEYRSARPEEWDQCSLLISLGLSPRARPFLSPVLAAAQHITPLVVLRFIARTAFGRGATCEAAAASRAAQQRAADRMHALMLREGNRAALAQRLGELVAEEAEHKRWRALMWGQLASLRCPVQIQWGEADVWLPASRADAFREAAAAGGRGEVDVRLFEGVGHCVAEQVPSLSAEAAWAHIRGSLPEAREAPRDERQPCQERRSLAVKPSLSVTWSQAQALWSARLRALQAQGG